MIARLAWRNVWRNRRRTLITIAALSLGSAGLVLTHSFAETSYRTMIELTTQGLLGHLQVHGKGYQAEPSIFTVVKQPAAVRAQVERTLPGAVALFRVMGFGLAAAGERSTAVAIIGLEPSRERASSRLLELSSGRAPADGKAREVVIGAELARRLGVKQGGEVVLLSQAADGSMTNDVCTVVGLSAGAGALETGGAPVFMSLADAQDFFVLGEAVHQVVVNLPRGARPKEAAARLRAELDSNVLEALAWNEMLPEAELGIEADRQGTYVMDAIVFLLVVLGMLNAMTMATFERMFELGVLSALGTRPRAVLAMILCESLFLGVISLAAGVVLAFAIVGALPPIDLGSAVGDAAFGGMAMPTVLTIEVAPLALVMSSATVTITCLVGGLYPAWRASRFRPVEAMRYRA